jgi:hypothetical protein
VLPYLFCFKDCHLIIRERYPFVRRGVPGHQKGHSAFFFWPPKSRFGLPERHLRLLKLGLGLLKRRLGLLKLHLGLLKFGLGLLKRHSGLFKRHLGLPGHR